MTEEKIVEYVEKGLREADSMDDHVNIVTRLIRRIRKLSQMVTDLLAENKRLKEKSPKEDEELFLYIMPGVTEDADRLKIHKEIKNLVKVYPLATIWENLERLSKEGKVYFKGVKCELVYNELVRIGLPSTKTGFAKGTFENLYKKNARTQHPAPDPKIAG